MPAGPRATIVCLLAAHAGAAAAATSSGRQPIVTTLALLAVGVLAAAASVVDLVEQRLPNVVVEAILVVAGIAVVVDPAKLAWVVTGALAGAVPLLWVRLSRGLGMGDVKFAGALGAVAGLVHPVLALVAVFIAAAASGTYGLVRGHSRLALGPWLWGGLVAALALSPIVCPLVTIGASR